MEGYRRELKYIVNDGVLAQIRNRINGIMELDPHQKGDFYRIRSLYLDSPDYECLRENEAGISSREKYRVRIYDCMDSKISAEIKIRHRETISKMSVDIPKEALLAIIEGDNFTACSILAELKDKLEANLSDKADDYTKKTVGNKIRTLEKYICKLAGRMYKSAVIVDYERCAFVYDTCNVRITFDRNINGSKDFIDFFDEDLLGRPAIEGGNHVLEIKFDEFLPDEIALALEGCGLVRGSCSKYARCIYAYDI